MGWWEGFGELRDVLLAVAAEEVADESDDYAWVVGGFDQSAEGDGVVVLVCYVDGVQCFEVGGVGEGVALWFSVRCGSG